MAATTIETARLILRTPSPEEARALAAGESLASQPCAVGYPTEDTPQAFAALINGTPGGAFGPFLIVRKHDGLAIGDIGLHETARAGVLTGGYGIAESARGRGFATEALFALIDQAFSDPQVLRIELETQLTNTASRRVMEKAGLTLAGEADSLLHFAIDNPALAQPAS